MVEKRFNKLTRASAAAGATKVPKSKAIRNLKLFLACAEQYRNLQLMRSSQDVPQAKPVLSA